MKNALFPMSQKIRTSKNSMNVFEIQDDCLGFHMTFHNFNMYICIHKYIQFLHSKILSMNI